MAPRTEKDILREKLKQLRTELSSSQSQKNSFAVIGRLQQFVDWSKINSVHTYLPMVQHNEIDTWSFTNWLFVSHPKIRVYTTLYKPKRPLKHALIDKTTEYQEDKLKVPSPINGQVVESQEFDVVIVPLIGFDALKHRLGYGAGVYDRILAEQPRAQKIGLAHEVSFVKEGLPAQEHDIPLDAIITPAIILD
ncbi:MAG: 5-formyltetrahydrofolate cyclo-ligase [Candidatus Saccharimonadales bacterium]|nr:5-formyltetrahydrofolate cyclo-ligase [Candidatus Saccharimonadales bacterium]